MAEVEFGARKKKTKSFALDGYLVNQLEKMTESGEYGSQSSIVSVALYEFIDRHVAPQTPGLNMVDAIQEYLKSPEGKALIKSIIRESLASPSKNSQPIVVEDIIE